MNEPIADAMIIWESGQGDFLTPNFHCDEFEDGMSRITMISLELVEKLQMMRDELKLPLRITSAYRSEVKQKSLRDAGYPTAKGISQHELGRAVDIDISSYSPTIKQLVIDTCTKHFRAIGLSENFIHVDLRDDKERVWKY